MTPRTKLDGAQLLADARRVATGPLRFGDEQQIRAVRFLADAQQYYEHLLACDRCVGGTATCVVGRNLDASAEVEDAAWRMLCEQRVVERAGETRV